MNKSIASLLAMLFLVGLLNGCALMQPAPAKEQAALTKRVQAFWQAKADQDWGAAYDMTVNEYKKQISRDKFLKWANVNVVSFTIQEVTVTEPRAKGVALVNFSFNQMGFTFEKTNRQEWWYQDGEWRVNMLPSLDFPLMKRPERFKNKGK